MRSTLKTALALAMLIALSGAAWAQSTIRSMPMPDRLIEAYIAQIGYRDLHNSNGVRLSSPWQVLRQDRANFHAFGIRDPFDEWDSFFGDAGNRAIMEDMLRSGSISPQAARDIMSGQAIVLVEIHGSGSVGRSIHVSVAR